VLVNTSLNLRGEPIVETPQEALAVLAGTEVDALVVGNRLIGR
jgi:carbamoyltransferase